MPYERIDQMECTNCQDDLDGKAHVIVEGEPFCASEGRVSELDEARTVYHAIAEDGGDRLCNYVSGRIV